MTQTGKEAESPLVPSSLTTVSQAASHRGGRKRMLWAGVAAVVGLALLILLGPDENEIKERFEYYGAPGDLEIMPEISIEEGQESVRQIPRSLQVQPPPSNIEVEREEPDDNGTVDIPPVNVQDPNKVDKASEYPREDAEMSAEQQIEMKMPMQSSPDYFFINIDYAEYPLGASETERRIPIITVWVAAHFSAEGVVTHSWILSSNGSAVFTEEALRAVKDWKIGWRVDPENGRTLRIPFNFNSPYFTPERPVRETPPDHSR